MDPTIYMIYVIGFSVLVLALLLILAGKWIFLEIKMFFASFIWKANAGLIIFVTKSGDFTFPRVANLGLDSYKTKDKVYPLPKSISGKFLGFPYILLDAVDAKTYGGFYYPVTNNKGEPVYLQDDTGAIIRDNEGEPIPKILPYKKGATFSPELIKSVIMSMALTSAMKNLFSNQNQIKLFLLIAMGASIAGAYFMYDFNSNQLPVLMDLARKAATCGVAG
jgi:hypothetical protein